MRSPSTRHTWTRQRGNSGKRLSGSETSAESEAPLLNEAQVLPREGIPVRYLCKTSYYSTYSNSQRKLVSSYRRTFNRTRRERSVHDTTERLITSNPHHRHHLPGSENLLLPRTTNVQSPDGKWTTLYRGLHQLVPAGKGWNDRHLQVKHLLQNINAEGSEISVDKLPLPKISPRPQEPFRPAKSTTLAPSPPRVLVQG